VVNAEQLESLSFTVASTDGDGSLDELLLVLDGTDVTADADVTATSLTYAPASCPTASGYSSSPTSRRRCTPGASRSRPARRRWS
jgi:hypothetical protein